MALQKTAFFASFIFSLLSLSAGYLLIGQWLGLLFTALLFLGWLLALKYSQPSGLPPICLIVSIILAAAGVLLSAAPVLMIFGAAAALAAWDILLMSHPSFIPVDSAWEVKHLQTLLAVLAGAILLSTAGLWFKLQLPFIVLLLAAIAAFFALDRIRLLLKKLDSR